MTHVNTIKAKSTSVELLDSDPNRKSASIYNFSNKNMYIKLGSPATYDSFSLVLQTGSYWEIPIGCTDAIHAIWSPSCTGSAQVSDIR